MDDLLGTLSPYEVLNVSQDADLSQIRSQHRKLVLKLHPDRFRDPIERERCKDSFQRVQRAYEILSDPQRKEYYDAQVEIAQLREEARTRDDSSRVGSEETSPTSTVSSHYDKRHENAEGSASSRSEPYKEHSKPPKPVHGHRPRTVRKRRFSKFIWKSRSASDHGLSNRTDPEDPLMLREYGISFPICPESRRSEPTRKDDKNAFHEDRRENVNSDPVQEGRVDNSGHSQEDSRSCNRTHADEHQLRIANQSQSKFEGLRGTINGFSVCAAADTGADGNFIRHSFATFATMKMVHFPEEERPLFLMAHGRGLRPIGKTRALWRFEDYPDKTHEIDFFVLQDCIFEVMIGAEFLYSNRILSSQKHLLKDLTRPANALHVRLVKGCGQPSQRLSGLIRHAANLAVPCTALPDSGAQPNLISFAYLKQRGWLSHIEPGPPSCRLLQFADGSLAQTMGQINLHWMFYSSRAAEQRVAPRRQARCSGLRNIYLQGQATIAEGYFTFDVLYRCPWDLIVGHVFLDTTDAFNSWAHCFSAMDSNFPLGINPVIWSRAKRKKDSKKTDTGNNVVSSPQTTAQSHSNYQDDLEALAKRYEEERQKKLRQQTTLPLTRSRPGSLSTGSSATGPRGTGNTSGSGSTACSS